MDLKHSAAPIAAAALVFAGALLLPLHLDRSAGPRDGGVPTVSPPPPPQPPIAGRDAGSSAGRTALADAGPDVGQTRPPEAAPPPSEAEPAAAALPAIDLTGLSDALALYAKGDLAGGDAIAGKRTDPVARTMLDYVALRLNARAAGFDRIVAFLDAHRTWPSAPWLRRRAEEALLADRSRPAAAVRAFFAAAPPLGPAGRLALARALHAQGRGDEAAALVRDAWREGDLSPGLETALLKEFGQDLTQADDTYRADRLLYKESAAAALRAAERAGPQALMLAKARAGAIANPSVAAALLDAVPAPLRGDAGYQFARIQSLRRADKPADAAALLFAAPRDPMLLVDGDAWWDERRLIARKLLDLGAAEAAYRICAEHGAVSHESRAEAEFHAGWIALRFLDDAAVATTHFARSAAEAETPGSIARAYYWQARAAEAEGHADAAARFYEAAAGLTTAYYGQLARAKRGDITLPLRIAPSVATGDDRHEATRVVELLYALRQPDLARPLIVDATQRLPDAAQVAALGAVTTAYHDARATLIVGKLASSRGFALDDLAYPTFGIPAFDPVANSADRAVVYSIARQESAFEAGVVSGAAAKGLMQLLSGTARETAQRAGIPYDEARLTTDPAFNAKLGAAFLGTLLDAESGSYILAFAAYNAGGRRVQDWINAYGDPRSPGVDPVDWIELIPFTETRHYVQQVMENLEIYQMRLGGRTALLIDSDLRRSVN